MPLPRVAAGAVLVVPPFECAWLAETLADGAGCVSFEVRGVRVCEGVKGRAGAGKLGRKRARAVFL